MGCSSRAAIIGTQIQSHRKIRIWPWRPKHQQHRNSHYQENIIPSNDTPVTPSQRPTWHHIVEQFCIDRLPIVVKHPNFKRTVHHTFCSNHPQTFWKFISLPPWLQLTSSNHSSWYIISRQIPPHSIVRIDIWRAFVVVLLYSIMKLIIHLTFMPFQIIFHTVQHWTATVQKWWNWEGG